MNKKLKNNSFFGFISLTVVFCGIIIFSFPNIPVQADELEEITSKIEELSSALNSSRQATETNEKQLQSLQGQLLGIQQKVQSIESNIEKKEKDIEEGEKKLQTQRLMMNNRVHSYYKHKGKERDMLLNLVFSQSIGDFLKQYMYQQNLIQEDKNTIVRVATLLQEIETSKKELESDKERLEPIKLVVAEQATFLEGEVLSAKQYQAELQQEIATLTAQQQQIIAQKQASLNLPQTLAFGPIICTDDRKRNPGFGNAFAFYTFGIPHRVGMSQYGAYGRANAGQNVEQILNAYFQNFELKKDYDTGITIKVDGYGDYNIEEYVKRIYEMPESWPIEALKAQAILARSYALNYTNNGSGSICTTQSCQVFKPDPKTGAWSQAVEATRGWVMIHEGKPLAGYYASTAGGYTFPSSEVFGGHRSYTKFTQDGRAGYNSFQDVLNNAYDRDSPCMYAAQGWRDQYDKSAWLRADEVADIANVIMLAKYLSGSEKEHLYQVDKPNPAGKETWSHEKVRTELSSRGGSPLSSVSSVSVSADFGGGRSTTVSIDGRSFSASEFKDWFNLRAPANIQIVGPLFNVERK